MTTYMKASDGLPARVVRAWSAEKLFTTKRYMDIFTGAMKNQRKDLVYADFFSGPGVCFERERGIEIKGSPLLALDYKFTRIFLNDYDHAAVAALRERTRGDGRVHIRQMDCSYSPASTYAALTSSGRSVSAKNQASYVCQ